MGDFMSRRAREYIDESKAVDLLLRLVEIYSKLGPVWKLNEGDENGEYSEGEEDGYSLTVDELEFKLGQLYQITPEPFHERILQLIKETHLAYMGYKKSRKMVPRESEIGDKVFEDIKAVAEYLRNSWGRLHEVEERILKTFPPVHFDFRPQISELSDNYLSHVTVKLLEKAISYFEEENYTDCILYCCKAGEMLTEEIMKHLSLSQESNWWRNLDNIQKHLRNENLKLIHIHWFIYYLLTVVHFIRNPHPTEAKNIPAWMDKYKKMELTKPKWARIALICSLEASQNFQKILEFEQIQS